MRIATARRLAQAFFLALFAWLCVVAAVGTRPWQWRGWPIRWFLELDPLVAAGTALSTRSLYPGLLWALAVVVLTVLFGRVFCGWICPFGTMHHFVAWMGQLGRSLKRRMEANRYHPAQAVKYAILAALLAAALVPAGRLGLATLQTGLFDPIPLATRSFNLAVLSVADLAAGRGVAGRLYTGAGLMGAAFLSLLLLNLVVPRFYCRFICPLGRSSGASGALRRGASSRAARSASTAACATWTARAPATPWGRSA